METKKKTKVTWKRIIKRRQNKAPVFFFSFLFESNWQFLWFQNGPQITPKMFGNETGLERQKILNFVYFPWIETSERILFLRFFLIFHFFLGRKQFCSIYSARSAGKFFLCNWPGAKRRKQFLCRRNIANFFWILINWFKKKIHKIKRRYFFFPSFFAQILSEKTGALLCVFR